LYLVIGIVAFLVIAAGLTIWLTAGRSRNASTGSLSRETRSRDAGAPAEPELSTSTDLEAAGRERADETRAQGGLMRRHRGEMIEYEPVDEEELGVTRRQFLNRGLFISVAFAAAAFAPAMLAFLWPFRNVGFGGKVPVDKSIPELKAYIIANRQPYYVAAARAYIEQYPGDNPEVMAKAKKVYKNQAILKGMEAGIVTLWQRCVHLGCRVPFCQTSQWFECPCHGSKYNKVGEKKAGPAPRGLDHFLPLIDGVKLTIDTGTVIPGPPIGTNTTGQQQEGPLCV
jgi:cytochrome b6-f complex iron-sulfur subunit